MLEKRILSAWKQRNKLMVFKICFLTKDNNIQHITASYIKGFDEEEVINRMLKVSSDENFLKWLTPSSEELVTVTV